MTRSYWCAGALACVASCSTEPRDLSIGIDPFVGAVRYDERIAGVTALADEQAQGAPVECIDTDPAEPGGACSQYVLLTVDAFDVREARPESAPVRLEGSSRLVWRWFDGSDVFAFAVPLDVLDVLSWACSLSPEDRGWATWQIESLEGIAGAHDAFAELWQGVLASSLRAAEAGSCR